MILLASALPLQAVVNAGNPGGNKKIPTGENGEPTDPGFLNVSSNGMSSAVYLGDGWVLTAKHTRAIGFRYMRTNYKWDGVNNFVIPGADLRVFRLTEPLKLRPVRIVEKAPSVGTDVVMIGLGRASEEQISFWQVDNKQNPWVWTQVSEPSQANAAGILAPGKPVRSWGTNRVQQYSGDPQTSPMFITDFSDNPAERTPFEAQAVHNDSGGGVFVQDEDGWALAGIMVSVGKLYPNQPGIQSKPIFIGSAFFGNLTICINLAPHREYIHKVMNGEIPPPEPKK